MPAEVTYKVNYYVGALLAQGGKLWLEDSKIVFSPTSAIDRAMGAIDVIIPIVDIRGAECLGGLSRAIRIQTPSRIHKFEGAQALSFWEVLQKKLPSKVEETIPPPLALTCLECDEALLPRYKFCPYCGSQITAKAA